MPFDSRSEGSKWVGDTASNIQQAPTTASPVKPKSMLAFTELRRSPLVLPLVDAGSDAGSSAVRTGVPFFSSRNRDAICMCEAASRESVSLVSSSEGDFTTQPLASLSTFVAPTPCQPVFLLTLSGAVARVTTTHHSAEAWQPGGLKGAEEQTEGGGRREAEAYTVYLQNPAMEDVRAAARVVSTKGKATATVCCCLARSVGVV